VSPSETGSEITVRCESTAQSLVSAASKPSERLVTSFLQALEQAPLGTPPPPPPPPPALNQVPAAAAADHLQQLEKLHELFKAGALTEDEFDAEKAKLLDSP
jgi:hypothetical protein